MIWLGLSALQYVSINFANFLLWDGTNFVEYMRIIVPSINQGKISLTMNFKTLIFLLPYFFVNVYCYYVIAHLIGRLFTAEEFEKIIANKGGMAEN